MLEQTRVLSLCDERGLVAGMILADMGADVIQVEPPGGSAARRRGPFAGDRPGPETSLTWWSYARNTRSVTVDVATDRGRKQLLALAATADVVIGSGTEAELTGAGVPLRVLRDANPRLVTIAVSAFGDDGPRAGWPATDLTVYAASGALTTSGDSDRAPLRLTVPQSFLHAGAEAAVAALVCLRERRRSGLGQHVSVSAQQASAACLQTQILAEGWGSTQNSRMSGGMKSGPLAIRFTYPASDGHVSITFQFGSAMGPVTARLMQWIHEEGMCSAEMASRDYVAYAQLLLSGEEPLEELENVTDTIARFTSTRTRQQLFDGARERGLLLAPVATVGECLDDPHLAAREYWTPAEPSTATRYPGPFARFSATPIAYRRRAPHIGEHRDELVGEVRPPVAPIPQPDTTEPGAALAGLKVLDFSWVVVAPSATRVLADYGATVVKVESNHRIDTVRTVGPFKDREPGLERSGQFSSYNAGKYSIALNLKHPDARDVVLKLAAWADVVVENFTPLVMQRWQLGYEDLRAVNPRLVYLSTSLGGRTGPYSQFAGYGNLSAAITGFNDLVGWPDRPPAAPAGAYTDYVASKFVTASILAALEHRDATGDGQHIDLSQAEAALHFLTPALLRFAVDGVLMRGAGNRDQDFVPHGVFRCAGEDEWVALACRDDRDWQALCDVIGRTDLAADPRLAHADGRRTHEDAIEAAIAAWCASCAPDDAMLALVAAGVPCYRALSAAQAYRDPQLGHRGHFPVVDHAELGPVPVEGSRFQLSRTPAQVRAAGPLLGQHTNEVLGGMLGMSEGELIRLAAAGVLE